MANLPANAHRPAEPGPELSLVVPVFNGSRALPSLLAEIHEVFERVLFEVVLVNDGSSDDSEATCAALVEAFPGHVRLVQLSRNFGEHNAVLAGLHHARGEYVAVLDDDGQHPPAEALRLFEAIRETGADVVYGRYLEKHHGWLRNLGSRLNDRMATLLLKKPADLYLSSFKVMSRFVVDQVTAYRGARPYVDGLIYRTTRNIEQIDVRHRDRVVGRSNYGPGRLLGLWLDMSLSSTLLPLRAAGIVGLVCASMGGPLLAAIVVDKLWLNPGVTVGIPTVLAAVVFFAGVQLLILGTIGEYLGRLFLDHSGMPQFVVRYVKESQPDDG